MEIVLTDDVVGLGDIGETVSVKPGYARNYLIPRGLAMESSSRRAKQVQHRMLQVESKKRRLQVDAESLAEKLRSLSLEFTLRVGRGGKVFGSIGTRDISDALKKQGFDIDRRRVILSEPLKKVGAHFVALKLHPEVKVQVKLEIVAQKASKGEEQEEADEAKELIESRSAAKDAAAVDELGVGELSGLDDVESSDNEAASAGEDS